MADGGLLDEIFVALGFKVDDKKVKDFDNSLKTTIGSLKRLVTVASTAVIAVDRMTNALLRANQAYISFNQQTGLSIANMNSLIGAGMLSNYNLTPESMMSSIQALQSNLAAIRIGQGNIAPFQMLGINPIGKDATQIIEDLRVALRDVDDAMAVNIIQQMGLSPEMISMLRLTSAEMNRLSAVANKFQLKPEQREALNQTAIELRLIHMEISNLKDRALISIAPHLIQFLQRFTAILEVAFQYRKFLVFLGIGGVSAIMAMDKAVKILGITINRTFGKWLAALTAIYLILEDLAVWKMGGQSLIGDLYEWGQRGFKRSNELDKEQTTDQIYERLTNGQKRNWFKKYADWLSGGGFLGTITGGAGREHEFYKRMLTAKQSGFGMGNVDASQNTQQTNYINVNDGGVKGGLLERAFDYAFAKLQMDGSQ